MIAANVQPSHGATDPDPPEPHVPGRELDDGPPPRSGRERLLIYGAIAAVVSMAGLWLHHWAIGAPVPVVAAGSMIPFALLLAAIAVMPFVALHWWERNYARVAIALGLIVASYYVFGLTQTGAGGQRLGLRAVAGTVAEYISFIYLIGSLFIVSGGILVLVRARATPLANTTLLLIGAILANVLGTTGASMLLIRPFLRMNAVHIRAYHVVFFIFIVSNVGGSLTPIGDPPLFLGYLQGVPFWWVFEHCWPIWFVVVGGLLAIFYVIDRRNDARTPERAIYAEGDAGPTVSVYGGVNIIFVALIIAGILLHAPISHAFETHLGFAVPARELAMVVASVGSLLVTPPRVHAENHFNYAPIREVAFLFVGIFLTMVPALNFLHHENSRPENERRFVIKTPGQFYFACGSLSAVLDNAPTYLTFLQTKLGQLDATLVERAVAIATRPGVDVSAADIEGLSDAEAKSLRQAVQTLVRYHGDRVAKGTLGESEARVGFLVADDRSNLNLVAISMGAVLFGAMTYIGNGPNFMVRSIAAHAGVPMPSFFGYLFKYAVPALLPLLILVWLLFLQ